MKTNPKLKHLWSLICANVVVDATSNNVSLTNVLEEVQVLPGPEFRVGQGTDADGTISVPFNASLVTTFRKLSATEYNGEVRTSIIDPEGKKLNVSGHPIKVPANSKRFRGVVNFQGFKVTVPGDYRFLVEVKEDKKKEFEKMGEANLEVKIALPAVQK